MRIERSYIYNIVPAIRNARLSHDSLEKSDSEGGDLGKADKELALRLCKAGSSHRKFMRQIFIAARVTAKWSWWKEYATYKIGTTENSTSTMHTLTKYLLSPSDFGWDESDLSNAKEITLMDLNNLIMNYQETEDEYYFNELIDLLPGSFLYTRFITLNYEVAINILKDREGHRHPEWKPFCNWIKTLPHSELIIEGAK
jgi:hypothetical protein